MYTYLISGATLIYTNKHIRNKEREKTDMICYGKMPKTIFFRVKCKKKICYLEKYKNDNPEKLVT
jgi:hypothetical protein